MIKLFNTEMNKTQFIKINCKSDLDLYDLPESTEHSFEEGVVEKRFSTESPITSDNIATITRDGTAPFNSDSRNNIIRRPSLFPSEVIYLTGNQPQNIIQSSVTDKPEKIRKLFNNPGKKIFEEFLTVGIESRGLEYITDIDSMMLAPKITGNYPDMLLEHELQ